MTDLERDVVEAWHNGLTEREIARYLMVNEEKVQRIIDIEEATCQMSNAKS